MAGGGRSKISSKSLPQQIGKVLTLCLQEFDDLILVLNFCLQLVDGVFLALVSISMFLTFRDSRSM
eukprot:11827219-Karenia_brevis.AAC.1